MSDTVVRLVNDHTLVKVMVPEVAAGLIATYGNAAAKSATDAATSATAASSSATAAANSAATADVSATRTVRYGVGPPSAGIGTNGDFYIATDTNFIYGPKAGGVWPAGASLVGAPGVNGGVGSSAGFAALFSAAAGMAVGVGITRVKLSGYAAAGLGGADYIYDAAVNAAFVTANPRTAFLAADGRGFRLDPLQRLTLEMFGALGNCTAVGVGTDDSAALKAARDYIYANGGGTLHIGRKRYRIIERIEFKEMIKIVGVGNTNNPGLVNGVTYSGVMLYEGSIFVFDADVAGFIAYAHTDDPDAAAYAASTNNATKFEFKSATGSTFEDFMMIGGLGTGLTAHGFEYRCIVNMVNVAVFSFAGNGFLCNASTSEPGIPYGLADGSLLTRCKARFNKLHGFNTRGNDGNTITFFNTDAANNGGAGYQDSSILGNVYLNAHTATNNQSWGTPGAHQTAVRADWAELSDQNTGAFHVSSVALVAAHAFIGCYTENGQKSRLNQASYVVGGQLAAENAFYSDEKAYVQAVGKAIRQGLSASNTIAAIKVGAGIGRPFDGTSGKIALSFGSSDVGANLDDTKLHYEFSGGAGIWTFAYANSVSAMMLQLTNQFSPMNAAGYTNSYAIGLPQGFSMGHAATAPRFHPAQNFMPNSGKYLTGDWVPNSAPVIATGKVLLGWSRLTTGVAHLAGTDWTPIYGTTS